MNVSHVCSVNKTQLIKNPRDVELFLDQQNMICKGALSDSRVCSTLVKSSFLFTVMSMFLIKDFHQM